MRKFIFVVSLLAVISACSYNPVAYDEQHKADNEAHDKQNGI